MDIKEIPEVQKIVRKELERLRGILDCPKCGVEVTTFKFGIQVWNNTPPKDEYDYEWVDRLRCANCLSVFEEELKEVKSDE